MRFDAWVHGSPRFYVWKLEALKRVKRAGYKLLGIDARVTRAKQRIKKQHQALLDKYLTGKEVLEIGCGHGGKVATFMNSYGCRCTGVDMSPQMIEAAKRTNPGPTYVVSDSSHLEFADNSFDVVLFSYVLHHVADLDATISEAKRVGKAVLFYESCACERQPLKSLSRLWWKVTDGGYRYLTLKEWQQRFDWPVLDEVKGRGFVRYGESIVGSVGESSPACVEPRSAVMSDHRTQSQ